MVRGSVLHLTRTAVEGIDFIPHGGQSKFTNQSCIYDNL